MPTMDRAEHLRGELAASIQRTLVAEARRNERAIARVRAITLVGLIAIEIWILVGGSILGAAAYPIAGLTVAMAVWSLVLLAALQRGRWHPAIPWLVPLVDAVYVAVRQGASAGISGPEHFVAVQDLATITGFAGVLILSGAFRLTERSVAYTGVLAGLLYVGFAWFTGLELFFVLVHLLLVGAMVLAAAAMTRIVGRAVHSEVTRLTLSRLLPAPVLEQADADPVALLAEPRSVDATIVVTDLRGFTNWAEHRQPLEVLGFLNRVQGALAEIVDHHGGTVDKFMGDGMLAVFGAPEALARDHAVVAVEAVREMLRTVGAKDDVELGIGVHSGDVVVGCLGSGVRLEFTVLGDTVNTASRLEAATKQVGVSCLLSAATAKRLPEHEVASVGEVALRGRAALEVYTLR
jgi:class 3 adenylate cyclase